MASKKRSVLFEKNSSSNAKNSAKNNAETSDPEPSGTYPATEREGSPRVPDSPEEARLKEAAAVEAFVVAHILSRF